jgi:arsenite methyltransferase
MEMESAVRARYSQGAKVKQDALCCPVDYDASLLELLPAEIIEKDYGCGDPSRYVRNGDTVLDLGSGSGKVCYMAAQLVGEQGQVIGIDMNDDMLSLAEKYRNDMAARIGGDRVRFLKGKIQDLALDIRQMEEWLTQNPVHSHDDLVSLYEWQEKQRKERPLIQDASVDLVISNCVLNLVSDEDKDSLVREIYRVVKPGGRIAISDIICDELVPEQLKQDETLWSGCISGAFHEREILLKLLDAGFVAITIDKWSAEPWQVVEGIEFRSAIITATRPEATECIDQGHAVIYRGPFSYVRDDEGHEYLRGERMAVCERTFRLMTEGPYSEHFIGIKPQTLLSPKKWCAPSGTIRTVSETKGCTHTNSSGSSCC